MKLLTKELAKKLPAFRETENQLDPVAQVKFFAPWSDWTWYATEYDGVDTFFGLVQGFEEELGYFSLAEVEAVRGPFGLTIERDTGFRPRPLSQLRRSAA